MQESDWLERNPHQQHNLIERMVMRGGAWLKLLVIKITFRFNPNPNKTTAVCRIYFDVKLILLLEFFLSIHIKDMIIPINRPITGPPMMGKRLPKNKQGTAIIKQINTPFKLFLIFSILSDTC